MKINQLKKAIAGVFIAPKRKLYFGKIMYGTPYFLPMNYIPTIFNIIKLNEVDNTTTILSKRFSNFPYISRSTYRIRRIFGNYYYIAIGTPITIKNIHFEWKDKFGTPRFEWAPMFQIYFFKWQFCISYNAPGDSNDDKYYEMIVWYLYYSQKDIDIARQTWGWIDSTTKKSSWDESFLIQKPNKNDKNKTI